MQKTSVTIITEKKSAAVKNKTILHTLSIICDVVDVSNKLNKNLSVISSKPLVEWIGILPFLFCKKLDMEKNSFVRLKLHTPTSNLKFKKMVSYLTLLPLCKGFARDVHSHRCRISGQVKYLPISLMLIRGSKEYK